MYWAPSHYFVHNDLDMVRRIVDIGEGRLRDMDESDIDMQVLSISIPGVELLDSTRGTAIAKQINDEVTQVLRRHPERFSAFAAIAPRTQLLQRRNWSGRSKSLASRGRC